MSTCRPITLAVAAQVERDDVEVLPEARGDLSPVGAILAQRMQQYEGRSFWGAVRLVRQANLAKDRTLDVSHRLNLLPRVRRAWRGSTLTRAPPQRHPARVGRRQRAVDRLWHRDAQVQAGFSTFRHAGRRVGSRTSIGTSQKRAYVKRGGDRERAFRFQATTRVRSRSPSVG
jgi:hypothetical protein